MDHQAPQTQMPSEGPTLCSVCAWRADCKKKFSFQQGGATKCPAFTRDAALASDKK
ncbi:Uracil-DNA glycosylase [Desulfarculales bacterium]